MDFNPDLAVAILKRLTEFPYGIGELCANDFSIPNSVFVAQITGMMRSEAKRDPFVVLTNDPLGVHIAFCSFAPVSDAVFSLSITDAGKAYLKSKEQSM